MLLPGAWGVDLDEQADRIEQVLAGMALPVRINGGELRESGVRYLVTPVSDTHPDALLRAADRLAAAIGVSSLHLASESSGISLDVPLPSGRPPRLLPLLEDAGQLPPLAALWGAQGDGSPFIVRLDRPESWHMLVGADDAAWRGDWLRGVLLTLASSARPPQLQLLGIDFSGRQLSLIEALPHGLRPVAQLPYQARRLFDWLEVEVGRRSQRRVHRPHLVLVVADLSQVLGHSAGVIDLPRLEQLMQHGRQAGVHLIIGFDGRSRLELGPAVGRLAQAVMSPAAGQGEARLLETSVAGTIRRLTPLWLGAVDLDVLVRRIGRQRGNSGRGLRYSLGGAETGR